MKSNVKLTALSHAVAVLGLAACRTSSDTEGLVVVPMAEAVSSSSANDVMDASVDAPPHRIAIEPRAPSGQGCTRDVNCVAELATAPTYPFGRPFEKCDPAPLGEVGHFSPIETNLKRHDDPSLCCYVSFNGCAAQRNNIRHGGHGVRTMVGRPLRDEDGAWITARATGTDAWSSYASSAYAIDEVRSKYWERGAAQEHASVAEFARLSLVLLALGAPADLVRDVHEAALDEIDHARACYALASRFAGRDIGPSALDVARASTDVSLVTLVRDTLRDGCVGEAAAAHELREMARVETDAEIATTLRTMADDEQRHAALAWRILDFAMTRDEAMTCVEIERFLHAADDEARGHVMRAAAMAARR